MTVTEMAVPATTSDAAAASPLKRRLAVAPSETRRSSQTVPVADASTATTVSMAPALRIITGATLSTATGSESKRLDAALASAAPPCARLGAASKAAAGARERPIRARKARRRELSCVMAVLLECG